MKRWTIALATAFLCCLAGTAARAQAGEAAPGRADDIVRAAEAGVVCDGVTDAGPALAAIAVDLVKSKRAVVALPHGTCLINTAVTFRTAVTLRGEGWPERGSAATGTTLKTSNDAITPITVTGVAASGATIEDVAIEQVQATPGPGWAPKPYRPFFQVQGTAGVRFRDILGNGIYAGINANGAGRLVVEKLWGEFFSYALLVDHTYDVPRITDVHVWPFWLDSLGLNAPGAALDATLGYEQAHLDAIRLLRVDSPELDRIFVFGANTAVSIEQDPDAASAQSPGGTATKVQIGTLDGDSTRYCLRVAGAGSTVQFSNLTCQGQKGVSGAVPLPGAASIRVEANGDAVIQGGVLQSELADKTVVSVLNTRARSVISLQNLFVRLIAGGPGSAAVFMARTAGDALPHQFSLSTPPFLSPTAALPFANYETTNAIMVVPGLDYQIAYGVPANGGTYTISNAQPKLILESATPATVPALTVGMPPNPYEGQEVVFMCTVPIAKPTFTAANPILDAPTSLAAYQAVTFKWTVHPGGIAWVRLH